MARTTMMSPTDISTPNPQTFPFPDHDTPENLLRMISSRLRGMPTFNHVHCVRKQDVVLTLVVQGDQHVVIEDRYELFPSDALITSLRLLAK